jgi:hypothetical protein
MKLIDRMLLAGPIWRRLAKRAFETGVNKGFVMAQTITGGTAGNLTVSKIKKGDHLVNVTDFTSGDLTSEFSITADGTINNGGGSSTATHLVMVIWEAFDDE